MLRKERINIPRGLKPRCRTATHRSAGSVAPPKGRLFPQPV